MIGPQNPGLLYRRLVSVFGDGKDEIIANVVIGIDKE